MSKYNSILIDLSDNVITTLHNIEEGQGLTAIGLDTRIVARQNIIKGHKVAINNIAKGETIIKYGKNIGSSICDILAGEHVHIHNIKSNRGKELKEE
ncbi:UxaA family hydrolase [Tissierella praeacuta]|uniref:UxaA family hydrolase n=1 Tax=Tissierella praeacuta TaxID=43131 RepID=UPI001C11129C|nr:UxaA family hydrolase [Tissierella praeacuta]MBU5255548.1 UxaA family hydrolase [Tissierella praeacuta]